MDLIISSIINWVTSPETIAYVFSTSILLFKSFNKNKSLKDEDSIRKIVFNEVARMENEVIPKEEKKKVVESAIKILNKNTSKEKINELIESVYHGYFKNGLFKEINK